MIVTGYVRIHLDLRYFGSSMHDKKQKGKKKIKNKRVHYLGLRT